MTIRSVNAIYGIKMDAGKSSCHERKHIRKSLIEDIFICPSRDTKGIDSQPNTEYEASRQVKNCLRFLGNRELQKEP